MFSIPLLIAIVSIVYLFNIPHVCIFFEHSHGVPNRVVFAGSCLNVAIFDVCF